MKDKTFDWVGDIEEMQTKFGFFNLVAKMDDERRREFLKFRIGCLTEEIGELRDAFETGDADGLVDAHIDLCVFAIGTLLLFGVDADEAWTEVHWANMTKRAGIKEGRPNPLGLPDLLKPEGWVAPTHEDNLGCLDQLLKVDKPVGV